MSPQPPRPSSPHRRQSAPHDSWSDRSGDLLPPTNVGVVVLVAALAAAATVAALQLLPGRLTAADSGGGARVPEVVGMSIDQARLAAENAGLALQEMGSVHDPIVREGKVAKQVPLAGQQAQPGSSLAVTLSKGPESITVPELAGMEIPQAVERLIAAGLRAGATREAATEGIPDGQLIGSVPAAGAPAKAGDRIDLVVAARPDAAPPVKGAASRGPAARAAGGSVTVPKITGIRLRWATGRLSALGLTVGRVTYSSDEDHMEGYILRQSPPPGTPVSRGSAVDVTVNQTN